MSRRGIKSMDWLMDARMNTKGALLHWIIFGIIGAVGIFFITTANVEVGAKVHGEWPAAFLKENYFPAQKELLLLELQAREKGEEIIPELAGNAGYASGSECGIVDGVPLWNAKGRREERNCFPHAVAEAEQLAAEKMPGFEVTVRDNLFSGKGGKKTQQSSVGKYTYEKEFLADLGYSFQEYEQLKKEAAFFLSGCRNSNDIGACREEKAAGVPGLERWHYKSCGKREAIPPHVRKLVFCVESPAGTEINGKMLYYSIALDLTPGEPFPVEDISVSSADGRGELSFAENALAERYVVYLTDYAALESEAGNAEELIGSVPTGAGYLVDKREFALEALVDDASFCTSEAARGEDKLYRCEGLIFYSFAFPSSRSGSILVAVTAMVGGEESEVREWGKVSVGVA